jgi:protoporphyrinogen oxidase
VTSDSAPVLVVGAGPAGLTAGWELMRLGAPALLLEQDTSVGGSLALLYNAIAFRTERRGQGPS